MIGKYMRTAPKVLILDEPTVGVDVGARAEIYKIIRGLAAAGTAVLVISSDFEELEICDRVGVIRSGRSPRMYGAARHQGAPDIICVTSRRGDRWPNSGPDASRITEAQPGQADSAPPSMDGGSWTIRRAARARRADRRHGGARTEHLPDKKQRDQRAQPERAHCDHRDGIDVPVDRRGLRSQHRLRGLVRRRDRVSANGGKRPPIATAFAVAVAFGGAVGRLNGLLVTRIGINPLVATLGVGTLVVGINYASPAGTRSRVTNPLPFLHLTLGKLLGVPYPVYVMFGLALLLWIAPQQDRDGPVDAGGGR